MTLIPRHQASIRPVVAFRAFGSVRPAPVARDADPASPVAGAPSSDDEIAALAERIVGLEAELESERSRATEMRKAAFAEGVEKGMADAESDEAERLRVLGEAIATAVTECTAAIDARADVAVIIARAALAKVFGEGPTFGPMVEAVVRHQATQISAGTVLAGRVSAADFPDDRSLAALVAEYGGVRIERDPKLAAGACLFEVSLGTIDASIPLQAGAIDALLATLEPAPASER